MFAGIFLNMWFAIIYSSRIGSCKRQDLSYSYMDVVRLFYLKIMKNMCISDNVMAKKEKIATA